VHPAARDLLQDGLKLLPLAEREEDRRDRTELEGIGAKEHQVAHHAGELGQQGACPRRAFGHLHAEHLLRHQGDAELVGEPGQPVMAVGQDHDLSVVAHLEQLLGAAVHIAHDRLGADDALTVDDQLSRWS